MKIKKVYESVNTESNIGERLNNEDICYVIWVYYEGVDSVPREYSTHRTLEIAIKEIKKLRNSYVNTNVRLVITESIDSVTVLSEDDISMRMEVKKYNL